MFKVNFNNVSNGLKLLVLGAHCDDIEIGCGGTLLKLTEQYKIAHLHWVVFASNETRKKEAHTSAEIFTSSISKKTVRIFDYKDGFMPAAWNDVKEEFEQLKGETEPDIIFTHYRHDLHQDHRVVNELTWNTFRDHTILEYEIPKYDGDLGNPNFYVELNKSHIQRKNEAILRSFESQRRKHWCDDTLFTALMRVRGVECAAGSGYAEAFHSRKMVL